MPCCSTPCAPLACRKAPESPWSPFVPSCAHGHGGDGEVTTSRYHSHLQVSLQLLWAANKGSETSVCNPLFALLVSPGHCLGRWCRGKEVSQCEMQGGARVSILCSSQAANKPLTGDMTGHGGFRERPVSSDHQEQPLSPNMGADSMPKNPLPNSS